VGNLPRVLGSSNDPVPSELPHPPGSPPTSSSHHKYSEGSPLPSPSEDGTQQSIATSISFRQTLKGIEETNLSVTLVPEAGRLIPMSSCLGLAVLELFIHGSRQHCPVFLITMLTLSHPTGLMFKGVVETLHLFRATNVLSTLGVRGHLPCGYMVGSWWVHGGF
jgi:hypothetical protein